MDPSVLGLSKFFGKLGGACHIPNTVVIPAATKALDFGKNGSQIPSWAPIETFATPANQSQLRATGETLHQFS
jgi:hypothetical protein